MSFISNQTFACLNHSSYDQYQEIYYNWNTSLDPRNIDYSSVNEQELMDIILEWFKRKFKILFINSYELKDLVISEKPLIILKTSLGNKNA